MKKSNPDPTGNRPAPTPNPPRPPIDGCTESHCPRCRTHPDHRGDMEHAGIGDRPSAFEARDAQRDIGSELLESVRTMKGVDELALDVASRFTLDHEAQRRAQLQVAVAEAISKAMAGRTMFHAGLRSGMTVARMAEAGKLQPPTGNTPRAPLYNAIDRLMGLMLEVVPAMKRTGMAVTLCADVEAAVEAARAELCGGNREKGKPDALGWNERRDVALETLKSVLCDQSGAVAAGGSDADRMLIAGALDALTQPVIAGIDPGSGDDMSSTQHLIGGIAPAEAHEAAGLDAYDDALDHLWKLAGGNDHPVYKRFLDFRDSFAAPAPAPAAQEAVDFYVCDSCGHHYMDDGVTCDCTGRANNPPLRHVRMAPVTAAPAHPRALTASIARLDAFLDGECAELLTPAQSEAAALVLQELKRRMASTPAAPGIDLARVQAALKYAEAAARHNTHTELAADFADLIRRIDASPKGDEAAPLHAHYCNAQPASAECICGLNSPKGGSEAHSAPDAIDMDNRLRSYPWTYRNQPGNVGASVLGGCARRAQPGGDSIDHGLSLLRELHIQGLGIVRVPKLDVGTKASDAEVKA